MNEYLSSDHEHTTSIWPVLPKKWWRWVLSLLLVILLLLVYFIKQHYAHRNQGKQGSPVVLTTAHIKDVPVYLSALGNVSATYTVTVKTQINGLLMKVLYQEGQWVKKGDLLIEIDERPLLAQLTQYKGQLQRDQALLDNALIDLKRYQTLWKQDSISQQTLATQEALVRQYQGDVLNDKGLIKSTEVNLVYCHIISPFDGRVGLRLVDPGNFVQTSDTTGLVVITSQNPITVIFVVAEDDVPQLIPQVFLKKNMKAKAYDRQQNKLLDTGTLITIDNTIDPTTGTVKLRARFPNKKNNLFPNQFVNIKLLVNTLKQATLVATAAIQHSNHGDFVYHYQPDGTVETQAVKVGVTMGDDTVILAGLLQGQQVVLDGADKLTNHAKVRVLVDKKNSANPVIHG